MKKLLLGSTALVAGGLMAAPAMAADPIKIGVGGYYTFYGQAGYTESSYALNGTSIQYRAVSILQEGEIHFIGQTKLDNGTTIGLTVELEGHNPSSAVANAQIDEAFMFAFGDWGRIELGSRDAGPYRMFYGPPSALIGWGFFNPNHSYQPAQVANNKAVRSSFGSLTLDPQGQDVQRINYFTPRFAGFQLGVSYAPKINVAPVTLGAAANGSAGAAGVCGYANATNQANCPTNDYSYQDVVEVGVNYLNKFGDFTVALFGGYMWATFVPGLNPNAAAANIATGANATNWRQWVIGGQFGFAGFTLGASYGWDNNGLGSNYYTGVDNDTRFFGVGIMYETGPWQVSAGWAGFRNTNGNGSLPFVTTTLGASGATAGAPASSSAAFGGNPSAGALSFGQESADKFEVGANYALGPGVKLTGGAVYHIFSGPSALVAGQAWTVLLGVDFRF